MFLSCFSLALGILLYLLRCKLKMFSIETKQLIKRIIAKAAKPFVSNDKKLSVILNYHSIHPVHKFATKPDEFLQQMQYLVSNFNIISLADFYEMRTAEKTFPDKLAIVTFDDGYEDNYEYAFPILNKFGIKATIFVATGFVNDEIDITRDHIAYRGLKPLNWKQIKEMDNSGITFGSHTHTHPILTEISLEAVEKEISQSKNILEEKLGNPIEIFAYPLGQPKTFNTQIMELLKKCGFKLSCSTIWGSDNSDTHIFALHRIRIDACDTIEDFKAKVNGHWDFIRWIQSFR